MANWSREEVDAIVADYLSMLEAERRGEPYNKTEHRRELARHLNKRSEGSIERKHMNISAVLLNIGLPPIRGYLPLGNYQQLLAERVTEKVQDARSLAEAIASDVVRAVATPTFDDILKRHVDAPKPRPGLKAKYPPRVAEEKTPRLGVNYLVLEAANRSLGEKGELFVETYERARLSAERRDDLAKRVERVSKTKGDGLGYDIQSFEASGADRLIEVKTTKYGEYWPFFVTPNEVDVSSRKANRYQLYRVYGFGESPLFFSKRGAIRDSFSLEPSLLRARIA